MSKAAPLPVVFALQRGSLILDWAGPAEAFRIANQEAAGTGATGRAAFELRFVAPQATAASSVGAQISGLAPLPASVAAPAWIVLVGRTSTGERRADAADERALVAWLARLKPGTANGGVRLVTVCSGALLAAEAGLLDGRRVTTHHLDIDELRRMAPRAQVLADRVFVPDGTVWSSAGVTAGIDLALHLISEHCGAVVAARVAQRMAVALRRGPEDPQLSPFLAHRQHLNARLHGVQDAVSRAPREAWTAERMAAVAHTTPRTLNRLFASHAGVSPLTYLRGIRLALARSALEAGWSVAGAAEAAGFSSDLQLRRAWRTLGLGAPAAHRGAANEAGGGAPPAGAARRA